MKLDVELAREISRYTTNDGSRESILRIRKELRACKSAMSSPEVMTQYAEYAKAFGRVPVAICTACTILERTKRLNSWSVKWAISVIAACRMNLNTADFMVDDGLHPLRIEEYAASFIRLTTVED